MQDGERTAVREEVRGVDMEIDPIRNERNNIDRKYGYTWCDRSYEYSEEYKWAIRGRE